MARHKHRRPTGRPIRNAGIWGAAPKRSAAGIWGNAPKRSTAGIWGNAPKRSIAGIWGNAPKRSTAGIWGNTNKRSTSRGGVLDNSNWKTGAVWGHSTMGSNTWSVFGKQKSKMRTSQLISPKNIKTGIAIGKQGVGAAKGAYGAGKKVYGGAKFIYGKIQQRRANVKTAKVMQIKTAVTAPSYPKQANLNQIKTAVTAPSTSNTQKADTEKLL